MRLPERPVLSWALYDWANSAFSTTVMAGLFPLFFSDYWGGSQSQLAKANSLGSLIVALLAPLLGAIADRGSAKKRFLFSFTALGVAATSGFYLVGAGDWPAAFLLYVLASIGFSAGLTFYDALLVGVARKEQFDSVSALGYSLGYLGGGLLFTFDVALVLWPETFGLASQAEAVKLAFLSVCGWWGVFSLPLFLWVPEPGGTPSLALWPAVRAGWAQLVTTFRELRLVRPALLFLVGYWFYIDAVDTIIRMAVSYGKSIGLGNQDLISALLLTQFIGFPAAIAFGALGKRIGSRRGIFLGIGVYVGVAIWGYYMDQGWEFFVLAGVVGLVQGGVQALSRSYFAQLIPPNKAAEFFGFYNMLGKTAVILGPMLMVWAQALTGSARHSILSLILLLAIGAYFLWRARPAPS
ncbi:MAG: MFS transporter [Candidatus Handelsmanbacteria bacterium]|nr:MFS transporter [Candidatus Handelsmanbacteria bacterium]